MTAGGVTHQERTLMSETTVARLDGETTKVGSIWYTSWGYDQTNVEYFEVVRESAASIWLQPIGAEVRGGRLWPLPGVAAQDFSLGAKPKLCRKPRVYKDGYVGTGVTIDYSRTAWPYVGGGQYDTHAAGQPGH
jgi:hypothetical protein